MSESLVDCGRAIGWYFSSFLLVMLTSNAQLLRSRPEYGLITKRTVYQDNFARQEWSQIAIFVLIYEPQGLTGVVIEKSYSPVLVSSYYET